MMTIYDIDMPYKTAKAAVSYHFRKNAELKDGRLECSYYRVVYACMN